MHFDNSFVCNNLTKYIWILEGKKFLKFKRIEKQKVGYHGRLHQKLK
jgi:hypothetical protein